MTTTITISEARDALNETIQSDAPFEQTARDAIAVGEAYLGADNAHLTRIDPATDHWEAIVSTDPPDGEFPPGLELDLQTTYCRRTLAADSPVSLHDAPNQGWADDPAVDTHDLHCYHGTTLLVDDEPYGTICFVAHDAREDPFSTDETLFAELITRVLERELERTQHEAELTRHANLVNVLNRVLRHNFRNDMSVIRSRVQLVAEQLSDTHHCEIALDQINELIELSRKARALELVIREEADPQESDIGELVERVVADMASEYPDASVTVDTPTDATAPVLSSFHQAIEELIQNAATHAGEAPTVTVTVERTPHAIEIQIADDGPGLPDQDREVLETGIETPLIHGSGVDLWLVHWIVTRHGGTVEATVTDAGTTLTITIPRTPTADIEHQITQLKKARDQYQAAFDQACDGMLIITDDTDIVAANPAAHALHGLDDQELLGRSIREFLPDEIDFERAWEEFQQTDSDRDTVTLTGADGVERTVEYTARTDIIPGQHLLVIREMSAEDNPVPNPLEP